MIPGTRPCPECQATLPLRTKYCPACNTLVNPNAPDDPIKKAQDEAETKTMLLAGVAGMLLFFSFGFFLPAILAEPGFIWISLALFAAGVFLLLWRWTIKSRLKKQVARLEQELHVKCRYCGGMNDKEFHKCAFCGAPL